jgi:hypothetical protein
MTDQRDRQTDESPDEPRVDAELIKDIDVEETEADEVRGGAPKVGHSDACPGSL